MATLVGTDYTHIAETIRSNPDDKALFKAWSLSKPDFYALFQAAEDWFVDGFSVTPTTSFKAALDTITTTTNPQAIAVGEIWFAWKQWKRSQG